MPRSSHSACEVEEVIAIIGGRWKPLIIYTLLERPHRFGALRRCLPGITQKMLTQQLRNLEADQIVQRRSFGTHRLHVEYSITPLGATLKPVLYALYAWMDVHHHKNRHTVPASSVEEI